MTPKIIITVSGETCLQWLKHNQKILQKFEFEFELLKLFLKPQIKYIMSEILSAF